MGNVSNTHNLAGEELSSDFIGSIISDESGRDGGKAAGFEF
jgi:hypothetical protein